MELKGKTVLFLGSSVTYDSASNGVSFENIMSELCVIKMIKEAVSGTTLADIGKVSYVSRLKKIDKNNKIDLFIYQLSTNDAQKISLPDKRNRLFDLSLSTCKRPFNAPLCFIRIRILKIILTDSW